jgi:hypothetical protein
MEYLNGDSEFRSFQKAENLRVTPSFGRDDGAMRIYSSCLAKLTSHRITRHSQTVKRSLEVSISK